MTTQPTINAAPRTDAAPMREAGEFLRSRRERLKPADVGLPDGARRRTPGLRRDEVAMLAGIGTTWYTWLEQGRDVHPSLEALGALARALRLDPLETLHLFTLHGRAMPQDSSPPPETVPASLHRMLDAMTAQPALVLGRRWDVLAWNAAASAVFGDYQAMEGLQRNALHMLFLDPRRRDMLIDWEAVARSTLAMFRADCARHAADATFRALIDHLLAESPKFAEWWGHCEIAQPLSGLKRIRHPEIGEIHFEYASFLLDDTPDMKLTVFTPIDGAGHADRLRALLERTR
ncbi:helix-turn-helix transcriptional regulator [Novosphingobium sp. 1949]|uniref:Helix-turn-helix transcriptional regulator n=1 Tax=Novosphingobium organovorum TaxID=2930092 RepID=A0ABT0B802_9SPHN|nr:helix-turn-helix transcriptional regulator [Novosphingobium organovorum]MCJ2181197.1 helix-turn-helix transcriptional regulator [Novosphingobium organovorum]